MASTRAAWGIVSNRGMTVATALASPLSIFSLSALLSLILLISALNPSHATTTSTTSYESPCTDSLDPSHTLHLDAAVSRFRVSTRHSGGDDDDWQAARRPGELLPRG